MKIQYSPYSLIKKSKVNARDQSENQEGALIRIFDSANAWGVADLCPWPRLGDLSLSQEMQRQGPLFQRAVQLSQEDFTARQEKKSLLSNQWIDNNILVSDYTQFDFQDPKYFGHTLKIKADTQIFRLLEVLQAAPKYLVFRLDFNSVLTSGEFQLFLERVSRSVQIEYIEDPCAYDEKLWARWNAIIPLAVDFVQAPEDHSFVQIFKPSREPQPPRANFVITSAMDHPVGVAHALRIAQKNATKNAPDATHKTSFNKCGLLTLDLYEKTELHSYFSYRNLSEINFASQALDDFGIGMTEDLQKLSWKDLL